VKRKPGTSPKGEPASEKGGTTGTGPRTENNTSQRIQKKEGGLWKGNQGGKDLIAAARHANWRERGTAEFEGKAVFAEGPHPAEPERKREELPAETIPGASFWTHASQGEGGTAIGIVKTEGGETRETRGLRLQDGYPTHMAELYALGIAIKSVAGQRGENFNFVTDSRVALDMLTKRKGGGNKSGTRATKEERPTKSLERWTEDSEDGATGRSVS
jgi:ribonuclease HI